MAVLAEQEGHEINTMFFQEESLFDEAAQKEVPWKSFLITASATVGLLIYEERHLSSRGSPAHNQGVRRDNQEFVNLTARLREGEKPVGILAAEINLASGAIAAYSTSGNIYIWARLREIFRDGAEGPVAANPLKVISGIAPGPHHLANLVVLWSPNGK